MVEGREWSADDNGHAYVGRDDGRLLCGRCVLKAGC